MLVFDFHAPAELFTSNSRRSGPVRYRRFDTGAEAVRYAVEELEPAQLAGTAIECEEMRLVGAEIRALYDSPTFPLTRMQAMQARPDDASPDEA